MASVPTQYILDSASNATTSATCDCSELVSSAAYSFALLITSIVDYTVDFVTSIDYVKVWHHLPYSYDIMLAIGLFCLPFWLKLRPLAPTSQRANELLLWVRAPLMVAEVVFVYHTFFKTAALILLWILGFFDLSFPALQAALRVSGSGIVPLVPEIIFKLATNTLSWFVALGCTIRYPVEGIPVDSAKFAFGVAPAELTQYDAETFIPCWAVIRLRAAGVEPEVWRKGERPVCMSDERPTWI